MTIQDRIVTLLEARLKSDSLKITCPTSEMYMETYVVEDDYNDVEILICKIQTDIFSSSTTIPTYSYNIGYSGYVVKDDKLESLFKTVRAMFEEQVIKTIEDEIEKRELDKK